MKILSILIVGIFAGYTSRNSHKFSHKTGEKCDHRNIKPCMSDLEECRPVGLGKYVCEPVSQKIKAKGSCFKGNHCIEDHKCYFVGMNAIGNCLPQSKIEERAFLKAPIESKEKKEELGKIKPVDDLDCKISCKSNEYCSIKGQNDYECLKAHIAKEGERCGFKTVCDYGLTCYKPHYVGPSTCLTAKGVIENHSAMVNSGTAGFSRNHSK